MHRMSNMHPYTTGFAISKDGTTIGYRQFGRGPGLILVHGGLQASQNFTKLATALSDTFTLYVPDRRGRGLSGRHGQSYNLEKEGEDIEALVAKTGTRNLFGLSSGAIVLLQAALTTPSVQRIALYEPPLSINHSVPTAWVTRFDREIANGKLAAALVTVLRGLQASPAFAVLPRFVLVPLLSLTLKRDAKHVQHSNVPLQELIPTMRYDMQLVIESEDALDTFKTISAKVLLLGGSKSQSFLGVALDGLGTVLAKVQRIELKGLDHLGPDNSGKPERVASELRRFFA
jgi:pimeloyl-ACP methyl ester carboxylesterase